MAIATPAMLPKPTVAESALLGDHTMALQTVQLVEMLLIIGFDGLVRSNLRVPAL